jgi:predicted nucleic acid-binding Zn ribbon protein
MGPLQEAGAFDCMGFALMFNHRPIGQIADHGFVPSQTLRMKFAVKVINLAAANKVPGVCSSTKETRAMACGESCDLIKEEERRVALAHRLVLHVLVVHVAANPVVGGPAALAKRLVIAVKLATAIAHHGAALGHRNDATVWLNAILQGHGREPGW